MAANTDLSQTPRRRRFGSVVATLIVGIVAVGATVLLGQREVEQARAVEQQVWLQRLLTIAEQQRDEIQAQGDEAMAALAAVAESPTIELFLTEYRAQRGDFDKIMDGVEQLEYIRNYLEVVAAERGYRVGDGPIEVRANLPGPPPVDGEEDARAEGAPAPTGAAADSTSLILSEFAYEGIALVNLSGDVVVATDEFPPLTYDIREHVTAAKRGERHISLDFAAPDGRPTHVSLHPAYAFLDNRTPETQLAWILGLRLLEEVYDTSGLRHAGLEYGALQSVAVHPSGDGYSALTSTVDGPAGAAAVLSGDQAPAWQLAIEEPGSMAAVRGPEGGELLTASAGFGAVPVSIVTSIASDEALSSAKHMSGAVVTLAIPVVVLAVAAIAIVWHAARGRPGPGRT